MKKRPFTLIELLTVIAIIGILAGLLLPALSHVRERAKVVEARADIAALRMAISNYQQTYGHLPSANERPLNYTTFIGYLAGNNPRSVIFLETQTGNAFVDPWEENYEIRVDHNYSGSITVGGVEVRSTSAIWSKGPNKIDNSGQGDDIASWD